MKVVFEVLSALYVLLLLLSRVSDHEPQIALPTYVLASAGAGVSERNSAITSMSLTLSMLFVRPVPLLAILLTWLTHVSSP